MGRGEQFTPAPCPCGNVSVPDKDYRRPMRPRYGTVYKMVWLPWWKLAQYFDAGCRLRHPDSRVQTSSRACNSFRHQTPIFCFGTAPSCVPVMAAGCLPWKKLGATNDKWRCRTCVRCYGAERLPHISNTSIASSLEQIMMSSSDSVNRGRFTVQGAHTTILKHHMSLKHPLSLHPL